MPYDIICDGPMGPKHCRVVKKDTGKTVAHSESKKNAGLYVAFAEEKIKPRATIGEKHAQSYGEAQQRQRSVTEG